MMDLFVGYDKCALAPSSHNLTTFQTPYGALQLTTLRIGWTNSVPIFHDNITYIFQLEITHVTQPYIDNILVKGLTTRYIKEDGEPETIPENPGIRQFIWEHFQDLNHMVQWMKLLWRNILRTQEHTLHTRNHSTRSSMHDKWKTPQREQS